jgi:hypothetical protein
MRSTNCTTCPYDTLLNDAVSIEILKNQKAYVKEEEEWVKQRKREKNDRRNKQMKTERKEHTKGKENTLLAMTSSMHTDSDHFHSVMTPDRFSRPCASGHCSPSKNVRSSVKTK